LLASSVSAGRYRTYLTNWTGIQASGARAAASELLGRLVHSGRMGVRWLVPYLEPDAEHIRPIRGFWRRHAAFDEGYLGGRMAGSGSTKGISCGSRGEVVGSRSCRRGGGERGCIGRGGRLL